MPEKNITAGSWTGIGYIVYDPVTDTSAYMLNMLNGGSVCSWIGFAYLADMILNVVECVWAFDGIMFGATALGAGLIMTGGAAVLTAAVGVGAIVGSAFYVKNIGDRFYNSTQLMNAYLDGDKEAGEKLVENAQIHFVFVATGTQFSDALSGLTSSVFAETHLGEKIGSFFAEAFERTSIGCDGALEILNRISPKYTSVLSNLIGKYGSGLAKRVANAYNKNGIDGVSKLLDDEILFDELIQNGEKFTRENVMWITRNVEGKIVWLETGSSSAGFKHILTRHPVEQFSTFGITSEEELSQLLLNNVSNKIPVGIYGGSGTVYAINENTYVNIVIGSNGYVVTAHPITKVEEIAKIIFY